MLTLALIVSSAIILGGAASCQVQNPNPNAPGLTFRGKIYASDSRTQQIVRKDAAAPGGYDQISCSSRRFDNRVCVTVDELKKHLQDLNDLSYQCLEWRQ